MGAVTTVGWKCRLAAGVIAALGLTHAAAAAVPDEVTFTSTSPILQRSARTPSAGRRRAVSLALQDRASWARDQQRTGIGPKAGVMLPCTPTEHRHPEVPQRPVAQRGRLRRSQRADTGAVRATRPTCHARYADDRAGRSAPRISSSERSRGEGQRPTGAARSRASRPGSPRTATSRRWRSRSQRRRYRPAAAGPRSAGASSLPHDLADPSPTAKPGAGSASDLRRGIRELVHEGRNADFFDRIGAALKAGSSIVSDSVHLHSNGRDTVASRSASS